MLFEKDTPKICAFCLYGQDYGEDGILCEKRGPVEPGECCRKYVYDPLRRRPASGAVIKKVKDPESFQL